MTNKAFCTCVRRAREEDLAQTEVRRATPGVQPEIEFDVPPSSQQIKPQAVRQLRGLLREHTLLHLQPLIGNRAVQRAIDHSRSSAAPIDDLAQRLRAASIGGRPIDTSARERLEASLDTDLSAVKIHTDDEADQLSQALEAKAFASGQDIFFREGTYHPETSDGLWLLAHEATHTIQQADGQTAGDLRFGGITIDSQTHSREQTANYEADRVVNKMRQSTPYRRKAQSDSNRQTDWVQLFPNDKGASKTEEPTEAEESPLEEILSGAIDDFVSALAEDYVPYYKYVEVATALGKAFGEGLSKKIQRIYQSEKEFYGSTNFASGIYYEDKPGERSLARDALAYQARAMGNLKKAVQAGLISLVDEAVNLAVEMLRDWITESVIKKPVDKIGDCIGTFVEDNLPKVLRPGTKKTIGEFTNDMSTRIINAFATSTARYVGKARETGNAEEMKIDNLWQDVYEKMHAGLAQQRQQLGETEDEKRQEEDAKTKYWEFRAAFDELVDLKKKGGNEKELANLATKSIEALYAMKFTFVVPVDLDSDIATLRIFRQTLNE